MSLIIGHRGAKGLAAENTLASIRTALKYDIHEIEIDIHVTKDNVVVLNHDAFIHTTAGRKLRGVRIANHTYHELLRYRADLPTLEEVITLVNRRVPIVIEVKPRVQPTQLITLLKGFLQKGWKPSDFMVASFSQRTLRTIHAALPDIKMVINERFSSIRALRRARQVRTNRIALNHRIIWWGMVRAMGRRGIELTTFSLNNPRKGARWSTHGLHGIITDYPDRFAPRTPARPAKKPAGR